MIKEALQYIVGLSDIKTIAHNDEVYADRQLHRVPNEIECPDPLGVNTLSGFMDYVAANEGHTAACTDDPVVHKDCISDRGKIGERSERR